MMTTRWTVFLVGIAFVMGCGAHDRELLGDPSPEPEPSYSDERQDEFAPAETTLQGSEVWFDDLRFYGSWYHLNPYGMVWRPVVTMDWSPMTNGYWVWSSYGWVWVSYDPFGDDVYHYGFWVNDYALGWVWIPDYVWSPARVDWVWWDDCIAWAPLPPPGIHYDDPWRHVDDAKWKGTGTPWVTVPVGKFKETEVGQYRIANPKFKAGSSDRTLRREAPDPTAIARGWGRPVNVVDVRLDQSVVGGANFTRIVLPPDQQRIVDDHRAEMRRKPAPPRDGGTGDKGRDSGGSTGDGTGSGGSGSGSNVEPPKQKGSSPPPAKKEEPPKFKEKSKDSSSDKSKDSGKAKPDGDSKGKGKG